MDIRQLSHFIGVANYGGFTKAARGLNISQPALTRSVHMLEDALGVALFERTPRGVEMTEHGITLYRHATLIINSLRTATREIHATKDGGWGEVRIGIASLFSNFLVHDAVTQAAKSNPHFLASIKVGLFEDLARQLKEGLIDLIVTTKVDTSDYRHIQFEPLCEVSTVLVAGSENRLGKKGTVQRNELVEEPWVVLNHPLMDSFMGSFFAQSGLEAPASKVRTSSLNMLRSLIRNQFFIGFLPLHWVREDLKAGTLKLIDVDGMPYKTVAGVAMRKSAVLNRNAELLVTQLQQAARQITA